MPAGRQRSACDQGPTQSARPAADLIPDPEAPGRGPFARAARRRRLAGRTIAFSIRHVRRMRAQASISQAKLTMMCALGAGLAVAAAVITLLASLSYAP